MPTPSIYLNNQDVEQLGFRIESLAGPWDAVELADPTLTLVDRLGAVLTGAPVAGQPRTIELAGVVRGSSNADLLTRLDVLKAIFGAGLVSVRRVDQAARAWTARRTRFTVSFAGPAFIARDADLKVTLQCYDPVAYDTATTTVALSNVAAAVPLGTGTSTGIIRIFGAVVDPVVTYRDYLGVVRATLGFTRNLGATGTIEIDLALTKITRLLAGVPQANPAADLTSGDFFRLKATDGDFPNASWPTLTLSGGTGEIVYTRGWE
ncbi:MAG: hypothetical protein JWO05_1145 [Gemmatimonadetes bacterium]|nr:hypothetical protein [Gemmatimonadota bacterium]